MTIIDRMIERSQTYDQLKHDVITPAGGVGYTDNDGWLALTMRDLFGRSTHNMTPRAIGHVCYKLDKPPVQYIRDVCTPELAAINLNYWQKRHCNGHDWFVRLYGENGGDVRAVASDRYKPVSNTEMLELTAEMLAEVGSFTVIRSHVDPDTLHLKITVADTANHHYAIGAYVGNGEVLNRQIRVMPLIQVGPCTNTIIMVDGGFIHKHIHATMAFIRAGVKDGLATAFKLSGERIESIVAAEAHELPNLGDVVRDLAKRYNLKEDLTNNILIGTEGDRSRMGLVNGLSFAAHATADLDVERRIDLEFFAGAVLMADTPQKFASVLRAPVNEPETLAV